ncbi:MAG: hypothetical protein H0X03_06355 [Nitrosopumilus sp.]|nr:hypothetical protein [Nitrosopumilus sp.]
MSVEVFTFNALKRAWKEANWISEREHVTPYIWKNPDLFNIGEFLNINKNHSNIRLTVDCKQDLILIRKIYRTLYSTNPYFKLHDILELINKNPEILDINKNVIKYEGYEKSIEKDKILE